MRTLVDWISEQAGDDRPVMAAYPLSYDWMWVYWYLMRYAGTSPLLATPPLSTSKRCSPPRLIA